MIKVENLTKRYAGQTAIQDLNFEVGKGEIMGFLGPNGAGKSTTMRILSSFMPATSGRATIAGFDVFEQSLQARAHRGTRRRCEGALRVEGHGKEIDPGAFERLSATRRLGGCACA